MRRSKPVKRCLVIIGLLAAMTGITFADRIIYVDDDATGADNGSSWADACNFLQDALTDANSSAKPVEIRVAQGVYTPDSNSTAPDGTGSRYASFDLANDVAVRGGYAGYGQPDPNARAIRAYETVLSGDLNGDDGPDFANYDENSYHVVDASSTSQTAVLEGVTISGGHANGSYWFNGVSWNKGAGMYIQAGSPTINNCIIAGNTTEDCTGGTIWINDFSARPAFTNCVVRDNYCSGIYGNSSHATLINCLVTGNHAGLRFSLRARPSIINCLISANTGWGIENSTSGVLVVNSIIWDNTGGSFRDSAGSGTITFTNIQGGWPGTGNIDSDPFFMSVDDFHLRPTSPCIDAGRNSAVPEGIAGDYDGNARFVDDPVTVDTGSGTSPIVDMGPYEYEPVLMLEISPCEVDLTARQGGPDPNGFVISIQSVTGEPVDWEISLDCSWLNVTSSQGICAAEPDYIVVDTHVSGLAAGKHESTITISSGTAINSPLTIDVTLYIVQVSPSPYLKAYIDFPNDPFFVQGTSDSDPGWVKFTSILLDGYDPNVIYFQDSVSYPFHYDCATELLDPFIGMDVHEYEQVSLYAPGQQVALGAVIMPWQPDIEEYGIQFIRQEAYTREETAAMFNVVKASVLCDPGVQAFYFPNYEQLGVAEANRDWFQARGIPISSTARWAEGNACYSEGWALGELKYFPADQIEGAYSSKDLLPSDILLTDAVPSEVPFVAGILSLSASTPNSHVAILARTFGVPFAHLAIAEDANEAQILVGRTILLGVGEDDGVGRVDLKDVTDLLTAQEKAQILALKEPPALDISATVPYGAYSADTNELVPGDIKYFGGKAANYGILRRAILDNCPPAAAISFDLWNEFLDQVIPGGNTLREEIDLRIAGYTYPPPDMQSLVLWLRYIREDLFKNTIATSFSPEQEDAIIAILQDPRYGFDPDKNIRFRSSTNVEDSNQFSGAGLYDSFSGCLADDIDADSTGPCICDCDESNERGVFRAIRKVFASFYNDNAFLERLRHDVNEADVGMGLLVHHSFPDDIELANGVATLERRPDDPNRYLSLVTQEGAVSVANPEDGSIPEEVSVLYRSESEIEATHVRSSNLVILGESVLAWPDDYNDLSRLLVKAAEEFERVTGKTEYILDFEYKKVAPGGAAAPNGGLVVDQIREIPGAGEVIDATTPFLLNEPAYYYTFQGEYGNVFGNHRLKSRWLLGTRSLWLTAENLHRECFYTDVELEYAADGRIRTLRGWLPLLPHARHSFEGTTASDGWSMHHLRNPRSYRLITSNTKTEVGAAESPIVTLSDFGALTVEVDYAQPVLPWSATTEGIRIYRGPESPGSVTQYRYEEGGVSIRTSFCYDNLGGIIKTDPLAYFVETTISGLTSQPIVLDGYYSQTFRPGHHNFTEDFLFEPQLEPGISQNILSELKDKDIRLIRLIIDHYYDGSSIETYGFDSEPFYEGDIDGDMDVDLADLTKFAAWWARTACDECGGADLDGDGAVIGHDLRQLSVDWLEGK